MAENNKAGSSSQDEENYSLGTPIARGGMGSILVAEDRKLGRKVALKVMTFDAYADEAMRRRFVREAHVLARLAHPNIVPIHDIVWEGEIPQFYTMKLVRGRTLQAILDGLRQGGPDDCREHTLDELLAIFLKVCDAMAFAHSQGVVHRDLKPANVMVGEFGEVLVMDWGLAGLEGDEAPVFQLKSKNRDGELAGLGDEPAGMSLTMDGVVMGTPRYMSPEQAQGRVDEIDVLSDIFSLGGILYAILTLRPPVDGASVEEVLKKISSGSIEPPTGIHSDGVKGRRAGVPHCPGGQVPRGIASVAMKALALERRQRYQGVPALVEDITSYQTGFSTSAETVGPVGQLLLLIKRHRLATASLLTILLLSVGFMIKLMGTVESERRAADSERRTAYSAVLAQALAAREHHDFGQARRLLASIDPGLRGFDWRLLSGHCQGDEVHAFRLGQGSETAPQCLAFLPGSQRIALISRDGRLHVRDMDGREAVAARPLPALPESHGNAERFHGISFSPNEKRLAYACGDLLRVLDTETLGVLYEKTSRLPQFGWLDDERFLFGFNGSVAPPPSPEPGAFILDFQGVEGAGGEIPSTPLRQMCAPLGISADRQVFVLHQVNTDPGSWERTLHVFRAEGDLAEIPVPIYSMPGREYPGVLALSDTGRFLAFTAGAALKQSVRVLDVSSGRVLFDHEFQFPIHGLAIDSAERRLGMVGDDSVVRLYDFTRGNPRGRETNTYDDEISPSRCQPVDGRGAHAPPRELMTRSAQDGRAWFFYGHEKRVLGLVFDTQGAFLTAGGDGVIRRWYRHVVRPQVRIGYLDTTYDLGHPAASVDGRLVIHEVGRDVFVLDLETRWQRRLVKRHAPLAVLSGGRPVTQDRVSGDVVVWAKQGEIWHEQTRVLGEVPFWHDGKTRAGVLSRDETRLVGVLAGRLFCVDFEKETIAWSGDLGKASSAFARHALSPDGVWVASTDFGPRVSIHRFAEPEKIVTWLGGEPRDYDTVMAFARDGRLLYTGNEDGRIRVWNTATWKERPALGWPAHLSAVTAMAVSHDQTLIGTSGDATLKLFPARGESEKMPRREHLSFQLGQSANWIQFARDGMGRDRALLHSAPERALEIWPAGSETAVPEIMVAKVDPEPRSLRHHGAVLLPDGRLLVAGGEAHPSVREAVALSDCRLYDPDKKTWSWTGSMRTPRTRGLTLSVLPTGKVLVAGGMARGGAPLALCELYDPATGMWTAAGSMASPRAGGVRLSLSDGSVLAGGGREDGSVERYRPGQDAWSPVGPSTHAASGASWAVLPNGDVLVVGGRAPTPRRGGSVFDPSAGTWQEISAPFEERTSSSATTLLGGGVLLVGGRSSSGLTEGVELFDPVTQRWRVTSPLPQPRSNHTATLLADGNVLVVGGMVKGGPSHVSNEALIFDVETEEWRGVPGLSRARVHHSATRLKNGDVMIVGGRDAELVPQGVELLITSPGGA